MRTPIDDGASRKVIALIDVMLTLQEEYEELLVKAVRLKTVQTEYNDAERALRGLISDMDLSSAGNTGYSSRLATLLRLMRKTEAKPRAFSQSELDAVSTAVSLRPPDDAPPAG